MSASLVGSEMCIRDSCGHGSPEHCGLAGRWLSSKGLGEARARPWRRGRCLLYTSDAADDM
eukprot:1030838-Alexandrium_andersonii.AAC.1